MKVLKFGGTSVGTVESLQNVKKIVEGCNEQIIVVVSALGGFTDKLIATAKMAESGNEAYALELDSMHQRHCDIVAQLVSEEFQPELLDEIDTLFTALEKVYQGIFLLEELSTRSLDKVVSFGERLSSRIVARIIEGAKLFDSTEFIKTLRRFGKHVLDCETSERLIHETFDKAQFKVAVVPGFIAKDNNGIFTNLGRGGSDYTAAILAASLNASSLEIWTDVDGFMTADPRIISGTRIIRTLSFIEAMELCNFGAKVIYPPTIYPVFHKNIPIYIKNTFNPTAAGTCIFDKTKIEKEPFSVKGVSSITESCLLTVVANTKASQTIATRALNTLARNGVSVLLVANAEDRSAASFSITSADSERAVEALEKEFASELETGCVSPLKMQTNLATVAVVGEGMKHAAGILPDITRISAANNLEIVAFSHGNPESSIAFVVPGSQRIKALQSVHNEFFN